MSFDPGAQYHPHGLCSIARVRHAHGRNVTVYGPGPISFHLYPWTSDGQLRRRGLTWLGVAHRGCDEVLHHLVRLVQKPWESDKGMVCADRSYESWSRMHTSRDPE